MPSKTMEPSLISEITQKEKELTHNNAPVKGGPGARAQAHFRQDISPDVVSDITQAEKRVTGKDAPVDDGPAALAQSILESGNDSGTDNSSTNNPETNTHTGKLESSVISKITETEKKITGEDSPVEGGPTAQAQKHAGEDINSQTLHDITEGEKKVTGEARPVKGGPTAVAQSELSQARS